MISETPVFCDGGLFMMKKHSDKVIPAVFIGALLLIWELCVRIFQIPLYVLPSPVSVVQALIEERVGLWGHAVVTTEEALIGIGIALVLSLALGVLMDCFPAVRPDGTDDRDGSGFEALKDKVDIEWFFEGWDNVKCKLNNFPINYMELRQLDDRLDYYTPVIIANQDTLEQKPEMVKKFLAATEKGYRYAIENPDESAKILQKYAPDYSLDLLTMSQEYLAEKYMEDTDRWGEMKDAVWDNYTDFMVEYGVIDQAIPASECYTNEFLPE